MPDPSPAALARPSSVVSTFRVSRDPTPPRRARRGGSGTEPCAQEEREAFPPLPRSRTDAAAADPRPRFPSRRRPAGAPPPRAWKRCQMKGASCAASLPDGDAEARDQPASTGSGQLLASALITASAISWAQWLVASVTARADAATPRCPGAPSPSPDGKSPRSWVSAGRSGRRAPCGRPRWFREDEFTKPMTWSRLSVRSTTSESPFLVTVARMAMSSIPCPSSSSTASPRNTPSFHCRMHARAWRSAPSSTSSTAATRWTVVFLDQTQDTALAHPGRADHGVEVALEVARVPHVERDRLEHVVAQDPRVVELERRDTHALLPISVAPGL